MSAKKGTKLQRGKQRNTFKKCKMRGRRKGRNRKGKSPR